MEAEDCKESGADARTALGTGESMPLTIKISAVAAFIAEYPHFFEYSFIKSRLEALGFHGACLYCNCIDDRVSAPLILDYNCEFNF